MIGTKLGPYRITEEIGEGGMATVYRAHQPSMDRYVAVKVIRANILHDKSLRERFQREARLIARLEHPHLLPVYDFDGDNDPPYIVMRFLEGGTLKQVLDRGELPRDEILYMLRQVATALDYAHRQGVVHRDLKPSNIMIDREGNAFVTDFGIARAADAKEDLTGTGVLIGTPGYMAPEQAQGLADVDARADIYALGAIVFEMLTFSPPYERDSNIAVLMAHINEDVPSACALRPDLPAAVDDVVRRALAKKREDRFPSAGELVDALAAAISVAAATSPARLQSMTQTLSLDQLQAMQARHAKDGGSPSQTTPSDQQRQMTAVYLDATDLAEIQYESGAEAETVRGRMDALWTRFETIVAERGGVIQSRTDEVGVALWGREKASEDDPERAIRAALRMREAVTMEARRTWGADWEPTDENPLPFAAGIATGAVLLERDTATGSYSASGSTITLAGRLKDAAQPGEILAAYDTFTQVRGVFSFQSHDPLRIRGRKEPLEVYSILDAKPRAFRMQARGIEGVETKMIGREIELRLLQEALTLTLEDGETQVVTVVGEAGIGKSRLLFEFSSWIDLLDETLWFFQARATQPSMLQPYSLTRDLFSFRFQILDSDPLDRVHEKFIRGVAGFMGDDTEEKAAFLGQLVGFDFSDHRAVAAALENPEQFRERALGYLGEFFQVASRTNPVLIQIEDIHWADDRSLDLINLLVRDNTRLPLFVICMARPSLYDRRPQWGEGQRFHERIQLEPLSQLSSRRLVKELLKKLANVPGELRDLIVERADGNPFYIEELIKALIDDRVILKGNDEWRIDESRLSAMRVPPTLTGVLQSRLDTLPPGLQQLLQRASVVGRIFWDAAAVHLSRETGQGPGEVDEMLEELREREMILRREHSGFEGTTEYVFRHAILRDVTYETIVPRQRRALHRATAEWLLEIGGERASEHTLLVAEHFGHAGEPVRAAEHLQNAARTAASLGAFDEAATTLGRAKELLRDSGDAGARLSVDIDLGSILAGRGTVTAGWDLLREAVEELRSLDRPALLAKGLGELARVALWRDDLDAAKIFLNEALPLSREIGDGSALIFILRQMGSLYIDEPEKSGAYFGEAVEIARGIGDRQGEARALNGVGLSHAMSGNWEMGRRKLDEALAIFREIGDLPGVAMVAGNIAEEYLYQGDTEAARESLDLLNRTARDINEERNILKACELRGRMHLLEGKTDQALAPLKEALRLYAKLDLNPRTILILLAVQRARTGDRETALEWVGFVRAQVGFWQEVDLQKDIERFLPEARGDLDSATAEAAMARGGARTRQDIVAQILDKGAA